MYTLKEILWSTIFGTDIFDTEYKFATEKAANKTCRSLNKRLMIADDYKGNGHGKYFETVKIG